MDKPRILHAFKVFVPDVEGGIPSVIRTLCISTRDRFDNTVLVARKRGPKKNYVTNEGIDVEAVSSFGTAFSMPIAPTYPSAFLKRGSRSSLVVHHAPFPLVDAAMPFLKTTVPLIVYWHADVASFPTLRKLVEPAMRQALRRADKIIISDASILESSTLLHPFSSKCAVVPYGVDLSYWASCNSEEQAAVSELRARHPRMIVTVARLVPYKGLEVLLEALSGIDAEAVIVGEGPLLEPLRKEAERLGISGRVSFKGRLNASELKIHLYAARVFAFPSITNAEAFGIVQLEAMAAALPIVNTDLPTAVPIVARDGTEAITVAPNSPAELATALKTILNDAPLAERLGLGGRARALSEYSQSAYAGRIEAIYDELIHRAATAG